MRHGMLAAGYFQNYNFEVNVVPQHTYVCYIDITSHPNRITRVLPRERLLA